MTSEHETEDQPKPLVAHLTELRDKLLRSLLAILIVFICLFPFANEIYAFVSENGGLEYTSQKAGELSERALESISPVESSIYSESLKEMVRYSVARAS